MLRSNVILWGIAEKIAKGSVEKVNTLNDGRCLIVVTDGKYRCRVNLLPVEAKCHEAILLTLFKGECVGRQL